MNNIKINDLIGKRVRLIKMVGDPYPVTPGTEGTVYNVGNNVINVKWDNGRTLGIIYGVDKFEII
jgi:RNase P/RNase MRP subunit p29